MKIRNLKVIFKNKNITYKDHNFKRGITIVSGKNGSGKTTLFKAIANLIEFTGTIENNNTVSYVSQEPYLFNTTVYENLIYSKKIKKQEIDKEFLMYLVDKFELTNLINKNTRKLSGGEKMKVSIIRGIFYNPDILLLDEPTTYLDLKSIEELIEIIKNIKAKMDIYIISHNKYFIEAVKEHEYKL